MGWEALSTAEMMKNLFCGVETGSCTVQECYISIKLSGSSSKDERGSVVLCSI